MALLLFILLSAVWGVSFIFLRIAVVDFNYFLVSEIRILFAWFFLLPFFILNLKAPSVEEPKLRFFF